MTCPPNIARLHIKCEPKPFERGALQVTQELENQYEHRLAVELDRYDRLSEEVETVQQRCEGLLEAQQHEHQWELRAREQVLEAFWSSPDDSCG